jgi:hypothetical protein
MAETAELALHEAPCVFRTCHLELIEARVAPSGGEREDGHEAAVVIIRARPEHARLRPRVHQRAPSRLQRCEAAAVARDLRLSHSFAACDGRDGSVQVEFPSRRDAPRPSTTGNRGDNPSDRQAAGRRSFGERATAFEDSILAAAQGVGVCKRSKP